MRTHLLYLHGFRSSPKSFKAQHLAAWLRGHRPDVRWWCPQLPPSPCEALALVQRGIADWPAGSSAVLGSSLGGFYATVVAETLCWPAVVMNPAVDPARDLQACIGEQRAFHSPADDRQRFFFRAEFIEELRAMTPREITRPERYLAIIAKGDELLDWREMHARYAGAHIQLLEGSDHGLSDFDDHLQVLLDFLDSQHSRRACAVRGDNRRHMYALFDDAGKFHAGRVMSEADSSVQVELDSGKRVKVKAANVMLRFEKPAPAEFMAQAAAFAEEIDLDLAWEFAPEDEFAFGDLAREYFDAKAGPERQAAALFRLFDAPHYFRRLGKGQFKKAPEETVKAALLGIERKKQQALQIEGWADELVAGACPPAVREQLYRILFKPDKNGSEYKAVVEAAKRAQRAPLDLLTAAGAIESPYQFHWQRFLFEQFPRGTSFPPGLAAPAVKDTLPLAANVRAFSIDDSATTEIDDALSVQGLGTGTIVFGVHIAAPGLAVVPDSPVDKVARDRLSTVYMPGWKITMLPDDVVSAFTLAEGRECPAVSLYVTLDETSLEIRGSETRLERVPIVANLRHDKLDATVTEPTLSGQEPADYPFANELAFAFRLAQTLKARREVVRGKPENFNRPDYNFKLADAEASSGAGEGAGSDAGASKAAPNGDEVVLITTRQRGAPLDLIVAEAMILANSTWGGWLAEHGVPGIYRSQASLAPGIKVRMGTKPAPHAGMGVAQYAWSTSPLRRYVDLVNQWQIIACARHGRTAALVAPFKPKDAALFSVISGFDAAYAAYNGFQQGIERFWTLRWIAQHGLAEIDAAVMKDGLVRAEPLPLVFRLPGTESLPRGARVRARVNGMDLLTLELHATLAARLDAPAAAVGAAANAAEAVEEEGDDDTEPGGTLQLAIDLEEASVGAVAPTEPA